MVMNLPAVHETWVRFLHQEDPLEKGTATPIFSSGESHGQRNLAGYGPWGRKELNTDERLTLSPNKSSKHVGGQCLLPYAELRKMRTF